MIQDGGRLKNGNVFFQKFVYTQAESQRIAVLVKNPSGKVL